ncbi:site-specific integrase [Embleya sp. NPDC001921]
MKGSTYHRCYCRDSNGKPLGAKCPKLTSRRHGSYSIRQELPSREDGTRRSFNRAGYATAKEAQADLDDVRALLAIPDALDPEGLAAITDLLVQVAADKAPIPNVEETRRRLNNGVDLGGAMTVGEWLELWLASRRQIRRGTVRRYTTDVYTHLIPRIGDVRLDRLRVSKLTEVFAAITEENAEILENAAQRKAAVAELALVPWKGAENRARRKAMKAAIDAMPPFRKVVGPTSRQHIRATLRKALNDAIKEQLITFNPARHADLDSAARPKPVVWTDDHVAEWRRTREKPSPVMVWTPEQTGRFLDHAESDRLYALWHLVAFRGLRRGEACGLPWAQVRLDAATVTVVTELIVHGWEVYEDAPKSDAGKRTFAIDAPRSRRSPCIVLDRTWSAPSGVTRGSRPAACSRRRTAPGCTRTSSRGGSSS